MNAERFDARRKHRFLAELFQQTAPRPHVHGAGAPAQVRNPGSDVGRAGENDPANVPGAVAEMEEIPDGQTPHRVRDDIGAWGRSGGQQARHGLRDFRGMIDVAAKAVAEIDRGYAIERPAVAHQVFAQPAQLPGAVAPAGDQQDRNSGQRSTMARMTK